MNFEVYTAATTSDTTLLLKFAHSYKKDVQMTAVGRITDDLVLAALACDVGLYDDSRMVAVSHIKDEYILYKLVAESRIGGDLALKAAHGIKNKSYKKALLNNSNPDVRINAIKSLDFTQGELEKLYLNDPSIAVRKELAFHITDKKFLRKILREASDEDLRSIISLNLEHLEH